MLIRLTLELFQRQLWGNGHDTIDRLEEREKCSVGRSTLTKGRDRTVVNQTNVGTVSKATLGETDITPSTAWRREAERKVAVDDLSTLTKGRDRAVVNQTNIGTVSKATLGEWDITPSITWRRSIQRKKVVDDRSTLTKGRDTTDHCRSDPYSGTVFLRQRWEKRT